AESGGERWDSPPYRIAVPRGQGNTNFEMHQMSEGETVVEPPHAIKSAGIRSRWLAIYIDQAQPQQLITPVDWDALERLEHLVADCDWSLFAISPSERERLIHTVHELEQFMARNGSRFDTETAALVTVLSRAIRDGMTAGFQSNLD